jgi:RHS repeat-associated protein
MEKKAANSYDYSPCLGTHQEYSGFDPSLTDPTGAEVFYQYDEPEPGQTEDYGGQLAPLRGRLVSVRDRAMHTRFAYDWRGRTTGVARRLAKPEEPNPSPDLRYTANWFRATTTYDDLDRVVRSETGADVAELVDHGAVTYQYSKRGIVVAVGGDYGELTHLQIYNADGSPAQIVYSDSSFTTAYYVYDAFHRLFQSAIMRNAGAWTPPNSPSYVPPGPGDDPTTQNYVFNTVYTLNEDNAITKLEDDRNPEEWPVGAKPVSHHGIQYDALGRLTAVGSNNNVLDTQVSPFAHEESAASARPLPRVTESLRWMQQLFAYDGLGNITTSNGRDGTTDDVGTAYDRGFGDASYGPFMGPNLLRTSSPEVPAAGGGTQLFYDSAGNTTDLTIDRGNAPCSAPTNKCNQRLIFDWDEIGQMVRARRWDYADLTGVPAYPAPPGTDADVDLSFAYSRGIRVRKTTHDPSGVDTHTIDVFDTLRLKDVQFNGTVDDYMRDASSEHLYVPGLAHIAYQSGLPNTGSDLHVFLMFGDHRGSTSAVIDRDTGELVEYVTYQAFGATESDYRPNRWNGFREDIHFTGKEEDVETGLQYFGARYYSPNLGRFLSPDPLTIHDMSAELNPYAYVGGSVYNATDPFGLCGGSTGAERCDDSSNGANGTVTVFQISFDISFGGGPYKGPRGGTSTKPWKPLPLPPATPLVPPQSVYSDADLRKYGVREYDFNGFMNGLWNASITNMPRIGIGIAIKWGLEKYATADTSEDEQSAVEAGQFTYWGISITFGALDTLGERLLSRLLGVGERVVAEGLATAGGGGAAAAGEEMVTLYHGTQRWSGGKFFDLAQAAGLKQLGTPKTGIYLTDDPMRALTQYATGPNGVVVATRVPRSFAQRIMQMGGTQGKELEYFVNTEADAAVLNQNIRVYNALEFLADWGKWF